MEGLFAVIFIVIGIINLVTKQQEGRNHGMGGKNRQQGQYRHKPVQRQKHIPRQPERTLMDTGRSFGEIFGSAEECAPVFVENCEGIEAEDRSRTGSLDYAEESRSSEGICDENPHLGQQPPRAEITAREDARLKFTEESLLKGIVMAEVLGPPRAIKRNIR